VGKHSITVAQVALTSCSRIFLAMSRDGMFPRFLSMLNNRTNEPWVAQILSGILITGSAIFLDIQQLSDLVSIGTLSAFTFVNTAVLLLRENVPEEPPSKNLIYYVISFVVGVFIFGTAPIFVEEPGILAGLFGLVVIPGVLIFRHFYLYLPYPIIVNSKHFITPLVPLIPLLGILVNVYLICHLPAITWFWFGLWCLIGILWYFLYSVRNSAERRQSEQSEHAPLFSGKNFSSYEN